MTERFSSLDQPFASGSLPTLPVCVNWKRDECGNTVALYDRHQMYEYARQAVHEVQDAQVQRLRGTLDALREMVDQGTVFVSAWVLFDEVRSYRVTARGRDGWRKTADAKSLEDAIREADATNWSPAINLDTGETA